MKKDSYISFRNIAVMALVLIGLVFAGCKKEELTTPINQEKSTTNISLITVKNSMLYFPNMETFMFTLEKLEKENEEFMNNFSTATKTLKSHEEIEKFIENTNWNENKIFEEFETKYNFTSLRSVIAEEMVEFNKIYDPKGIENPDDHFLRNPYLRTLLNSQCQVQIGKSIYKFLDNGATIVILNENYKIAEDINSSNFMEYKLNEEIFVDYDFAEKGANCRMYGGFNWYEVKRINYNNYEIRFCLRCDVDNNEIARNIRGVAKTEYWNGHKWKNYHPYKISITPQGDVYLGGNCHGSTTPQSSTKTKYGESQVAETCPVRFGANQMNAFSFERYKIKVAATVWLDANTSYNEYQVISW